MAGTADPNVRSIALHGDVIAQHALLENLRRLAWLICLLAPLSLVQVTAWWFEGPPAGGSGGFESLGADGPGGTIAARWTEAVVIAHLGMAANLLLLGGLIWWLRRQPAQSRVLQGALEAWGLVSALGFTIIVAGIDPWISARITPFAAGCVLVGAIFLLRPIRAATLFIGAFGAYALVLGLTQGESVRLLSSRFDGLVAALLGFFVSQAIWRKHVVREALAAELKGSRQALHEQGEELRAMAVRDSLTGVWNRGELMRLAQRELTRVQRHGGETCFLVVDLDSFQQVNDRWGHVTGDRVLQAVARLLVDELRATDEVGRLAGEAFAVLLPQTSLEEARQLAERLHQAVGRMRVPLGDAAVRVTVSVGVASQTGRALVPVPQQLDRLFASAEQAVGTAKSLGRDRVAVAPPPELV